MQPGAPPAAQAESGTAPHSSGLPARPGLRPVGRGWASLASLGFAPATPLPHGAPPAAQAESGLDPTRVGSQPDPGFALQEGLHLPLSRSASARRRPCSLARLRQRRLNLGRTPPEWAPGLRPGGGRLRPPLRRSASTLRRPCNPLHLWLRMLNLGQTPPESAPCPTLDLPGGEWLHPPLHCSASARRRPCRLTPSATKAESGPGATRVGALQRRHLARKSPQARSALAGTRHCRSPKSAKGWAAV